MHLLFVGSGYVGLVSGVMLASKGLEVTCIDSDKNKIDMLIQGKLPIYEPGLDEYISLAQRNKNLHFIHSYEELKSPPDAVFITVGTPSLESGDADLSYVYDAALTAAQNTPETTIIILKSTVPPGTSAAIQEFLKSRGYIHSVVANPEFLREGKAIMDFLNPDRVVIGVKDNRTQEVMKEIYKDFTPLFFTDLITAELIKYASNSFLATKIAFINEMGNICEKIGGDVTALAKGMGMDKRIAPDFLKVGPGFGGSCFPKDILALQFLARKYDEPFYVLSAVIEANAKRRKQIVDKMEAQIGSVRGKTIGVLGLAFKADTDDIRSSPALDIVELLIELGANVKAYDPEAMDNAKSLALQIELTSGENVFVEADAVVILTEWEEFRNLNYLALGEKMKSKIIFDFRNILDSSLLEKNNFRVFQLGKKHA